MSGLTNEDINKLLHSGMSRDQIREEMDRRLAEEEERLKQEQVSINASSDLQDGSFNNYVKLVDDDEPVEKSSEDKYAPTSWGKTNVGALVDLRVPSGQLCQIRRPDLSTLAKMGLLNEFDTISRTVYDKHIEGGEKQVNNNEIMNLLSDPQKAEKMFEMVDRIVCFVVVQPKIYRTPNDVTNRKNDRIYVDSVDMEDRFFIFNYALGGTKDIDSFRDQSKSIVGDLEPS